MLRHFVYLDEVQLDQFIAQVEDGLRRARTRKAGSQGSISGSVKVGPIGGGGKRGTSAEETEEFADSPHARFNRLIELVAGNEDAFSWRTLLQESDFQNLPVGAITEFDAELYESDFTKVAGPNGILSTLPLLRQMQSAFSSWNSAAAGLPSETELNAIEGFAKASPDQIILGDIADTEWRFATTLPAISDVEGDARVVGKVTRVIPAGKSEPMPGLPFISQMPRAQRREFIAKGPTAGQEMMWIEGPALILDPLAVYR